MKSKANRKRKRRFQFWASEEEETIIRERMAEVGIVSLGAYFRKMAMDGLFIYLDLSDVKDMVMLLRRCSNSLNQIAKQANETHSIYESDIVDLRRQYDTLWGGVNKILQELAKIKT